jgi:ferredoxin
MRELQELAQRLLTDGTVKLVIGYEVGPHGVRPAFIMDPKDAARLVFDHRCAQDLVTYMSPRRAPLRALGKTAIVVKPCDARAIAGLVRETQLKREDVVVIGVRCGGVTADTAAATLTGDNVADRCPGCKAREPGHCDHVVGPAATDPPGTAARDAKIAALEKLPPEERLAFFVTELGRCVRCYACREVCPLCFCERCLADKTEPQWIESSPHPRGNFAWHVSRALHLAGRCVDCGECARACPVDIPLGLLTRKVAQIVAARYGHTPTDDPAVAAPIGTYRPDDGQEFIR